jgi:hypothetical protein
MLSERGVKLFYYTDSDDFTADDLVYMKQQCADFLAFAGGNNSVYWHLCRKIEVVEMTLKRREQK